MLNCSQCNLTQFCHPVGLTAETFDQLSHLVTQKIHLDRNKHLCNAGDVFQHFYVVRAGALKSIQTDIHGNEQITHFYLPGEIFGFEAVYTNHYPCTVIAMSDTELCELSIEHLMKLASGSTELSYHILTLASKQLHNQMCINHTDAQQKIISFLLTLAERLKSTATEPCQFILPMSREEIGNYLGLAMETVSRVLSQLKNQKLIQLRHRTIVLHKLSKLKQMVAIA